MINAITELFLSTYFIFDAIAGEIVDNDQVMFNKLYSAFLLPDNESEELFDATQVDVVREIKSYKDYAQVCRIQKFSELTGIGGVSSKDYEMVVIKGNALKKLKQFGLEEHTIATNASVCKFLNDTANIGFVFSLCMLGFLQCEGIFVEKNEKLGRKNLAKAALWNSIEGILLSFVYDNSTRQKNLDRLYTITHKTLYESIYNKAKETYSLNKANLVPESNLLKKAFGVAILKPETYMPQYARIIFSDVLSFKDKERTLFSGQKEAIVTMADLPLKLSYSDLLFDAKALEALPITREHEQNEIASIISNVDMRIDSSYRPLCFCGDSEYLLMLYVRTIEKIFPLAHIEIIDVDDLNEYDFEPTANNIFVRSCDENKQNVLILYCKGEIKEYVLGMVKNFLKTDKRKSFRLQHPNSVIDLSSVLPICFCDNQNAKVLRTCCETIKLAPVNDLEKNDIVSFIIEDKTRKYGVNDLQIGKSMQSELMTYSIDRIEYLLDKLVRYNHGKESVMLTHEMVKEICGENEYKIKYGFGGVENESK